MYVMRYLLGGPSVFEDSVYHEAFTVKNKIALIHNQLARDALLVHPGWEFLGEVAKEEDLDDFLNPTSTTKVENKKEEEKQNVDNDTFTKIIDVNNESMYVDTNLLFTSKAPEPEWWKKEK